MIEQNSNFFDQLDGGWGDVIANTYTEGSILHGFLKQKKAESEKADEELLHELGYSDEDTLNMNL